MVPCSKLATLFSPQFCLLFYLLWRSALVDLLLKGNFSASRQMILAFWKDSMKSRVPDKKDETRVCLCFSSITVGDSSKGTTCGLGRWCRLSLHASREGSRIAVEQRSSFFPSFITCIHICKGTFYCVYVSREKFSVAAATVMSQKRKRIRREYNSREQS